MNPSFDIQDKPTRAVQFYSARKAAGLTQIEAAMLLDVTTRTVKRWEAGQTEPGPAHIQMLQLYKGATKQHKADRKGEAL